MVHYLKLAGEARLFSFAPCIFSPLFVKVTATFGFVQDCPLKQGLPLYLVCVFWTGGRCQSPCV